MAAGLLTSLLAALMLADAFHDGAHPSSEKGRYVIALVAGTAGIARVRRARRSTAHQSPAGRCGSWAWGIVPRDRARQRRRRTVRARARATRSPSTRSSPRRDSSSSAGRSSRSRSGTRRSVGGRGRAASRLQRELLEHGLHRDDVPLEAELRVRQARRDPDQLREMEDRHLEVLPRLLLQLRLPGVE